MKITPHINSLDPWRRTMAGALLVICLPCLHPVPAALAEVLVSPVTIALPAPTVPPGGILPLHIVVHEATSVDSLLLRISYDTRLLRPLELRARTTGNKLLAQNATATGLSFVAFGGEPDTPSGRLATLYLEADSQLANGSTLEISDGGSSAANSDASPVTVSIGMTTVQISPLLNRHSSDVNGNGRVEIGELLRAIQLYNAGKFYCDMASEDGYAVSGADQTCAPHNLDYAPQDWRIGLSELLRCIQIYNAFKSTYHSDDGGEDGFSPGPID